MTNTEVSPVLAKSDSPDLNPTDVADLASLLKKQVKHVIGKLPLLGAVSWLMMQQTATRHTLLSELEWKVMPALVLEQAKLYMRDDSPVAYVSWAMLSDAAAFRYAAAPHQLTANDWKSGDQIWIIDLLVPFGGAQQVMDDLRNNVFAGRQVHQLQLGSGGSPKEMIWPAK